MDLTLREDGAEASRPGADARPAASATAETAAPERPVGPGFQASLATAFFGTWLALLPATQVTLALRVNQIDPEGKAATLSLVLGVGSFVALVAQNIFGALSDRTTSRFGMRRPWILGGLILGTASLFLLATAGSVLMLVVAWALTQLTFNVLLAGLNPVIPDQVPRRQLGRVSGIVGITQSVAGMAGAYLAQLFLPDLTMAILVPGLIAVLSVGVFLFVLRDRVLPKAQAEPFRLRSFLQAFWTSPREAPDFALAWVSRFMVTFGNFTLMSYQVYFLIDRFGYTDATIGPATFQVTVAMTIPTVIMSVVVGRVSDRIARRKIFVLLSATVLALAHVMAACSTSFSMFVASVVIAGIANGVYLAVDTALIAEVLPSRHAIGKDMGVLHLANVLPQTCVPVVAPLFLAIGGAGDNYPALFIGGAVVGVAGAVVNQFIRSVK